MRSLYVVIQRVKHEPHELNVHNGKQYRTDSEYQKIVIAALPLQAVLPSAWCVKHQSLSMENFISLLSLSNNPCFMRLR